MGLNTSSWILQELARVLVEQWGAAQAHPRLHSALSEYMDELVDEVTDSPFLPAWVCPSSLRSMHSYCALVRVWQSIVPNTFFTLFFCPHRSAS